MYKFEKLKQFLKEAGESKNAEVAKLSHQFLSGLEDDSEADTLDNPTHDESDIDNVEGKLIETAFTEENVPKTASAYIKDVYYRDLPVAVQREVQRFVQVRPKLSFVQYGMTVGELLRKVDHHNFEAAKKHIEGKEIDVEATREKLKTKYILVNNDTIIDGHHSLAKAEKAGITNSLHVLDLTPTRFQKTAWEELAEKFKKKAV